MKSSPRMSTLQIKFVKKDRVMPLVGVGLVLTEEANLTCEICEVGQIKIKFF